MPNAYRIFDHILAQTARKLNIPLCTDGKVYKKAKKGRRKSIFLLIYGNL